jgi:hypothetical protein
MKEKEVIEDVPTKIAHGDHPEGAVNLEVGRITSENLTTSVGLDVLEPVPRESTDDSDRAGETEV